MTMVPCIVVPSAAIPPGQPALGLRREIMGGAIAVLLFVRF
jgi:hypothetical protein